MALMTDRKNPGVAFWASVAMAVVLAGYPLSFGRACWASSHTICEYDWVSFADQPILEMWLDGPDGISDVAKWYGSLLSSDGWTVMKFPSGKYRWGKWHS